MVPEVNLQNDHWKEGREEALHLHLLCNKKYKIARLPERPTLQIKSESPPKLRWYVNEDWPWRPAREVMLRLIPLEPQVQLHDFLTPLLCPPLLGTP